jgi:hypothetical protein
MGDREKLVTTALAVIAAGTLLTALVMCLQGAGCAAVKPACQVIELTDNACHMFAVAGPDGGKQLVSAEQLGVRPCPSK